MHDFEKIFEQIKDIPRWVEPEELRLLAQLADAVPAGGRIVEIGSLYGGSTAVLALANPAAKVVAVDEFSWHPVAHRPASKEGLEETLKGLGIRNVRVIAQDSRLVGPGWVQPIDLLWIDGGHSYEFVFPDLTNFGHFAKVIALHDYDNPLWPTIRKAVEDYTFVNQYWRVAERAGTVAVLRRMP